MLLDSNKFTLKMNISFWLQTFLLNHGRIYILSIHASWVLTWISL